MSVYRLTYFNFWGYGEPIRMILTYMGQKFQDVRLDYYKDFPKIKPTLPYGRLPILEIDDKVLTDSIAICRYLARKTDLWPDTAEQDLDIDTILGSWHDLRIESYKATALEEVLKDKEKSNALLKAEEIVVMDRLNKLLINNGGNIAKNKFSWADIYITTQLETYAKLTGQNLYKDYPAISSFMKQTLQHPKLVKYVSERLDCEC